MCAVDEVMMTFFPHPVQDIHDILKRGFNFDADASERMNVRRVPNPTGNFKEPTTRMCVVNEVIMTFFPHPVQDIHDILKRSFDFDADASEYQSSAGCDTDHGGIDYYGGVHNQNGGYEKDGMGREDDAIIFSRFDDMVSSVLLDEDQPQTTQDEEEEELVIDLQAEIDWMVPPRPDTLLFRKGWGLDGLSPFVCVSPTSEGPAVYFAIDASFSKTQLFC